MLESGTFFRGKPHLKDLLHAVGTQNRGGADKESAAAVLSFQQGGDRHHLPFVPQDDVDDPREGGSDTVLGGVLAGIGQPARGNHLLLDCRAVEMPKLPGELPLQLSERLSVYGDV